MARAIGLRSDFSATALRRLAGRSKDAAQARRLLALAAIYDGGTRSEAARIGTVTMQIVRDWVVRFNAEGPDGLIERKAPGPTPRLTDAHRQALAAQIDRGPIPATLAGIARDQALHAARPALRIGLYLRRRLSWRRQGRGPRPALVQHRSDEPPSGRDRRDGQPQHAVLLLDQAGWHLSGGVAVPDNITLLPLPPTCPELNVMENVRQFMRDNWLSNRVFHNHDDTVEYCCHHWNRLIDQPRRIMSIRLRDWAHRF